MKPFLLLLCLSVSALGAVSPGSPPVVISPGDGAVITTNGANRYTIGISNYNTLATNTALLNGTNSFTGTNTFSTLPIIGTNYSPGVPRVLLATNVGFFPVITNSYAAQSLMLTNDGLQKLTLLLDVRLPAVGPDERVGWYQIVECTNVNKTQIFYQFYCGENTNYINGITGVGQNGVNGGQAPWWVRQYPGVTPNWLFANAGSTTNQYIQASFPNTNAWGAGITPLNLVDTSTNGWRLMLGASGDLSTQTVLSTNLNLVRFIVVAVPNLSQ